MMIPVKSICRHFAIAARTNHSGTHGIEGLRSGKPDGRPVSIDHLFTATATPSRKGMIVVKKSGDL